MAPPYEPYSLNNPDVELQTNQLSLDELDYPIDFRHQALLTMQPDRLIWRLQINFNDMKSGYISFSNWNIPNNAMLFIFNNPQSYTGPYLYKNKKEFLSGRFINEKLTLEYSEPVNAEFQGNFMIEGILPDYIPDLVLKEIPP